MPAIPHHNDLLRSPVTNHVFPLVAAPHSHPMAPSTKYLHKRRAISSVLSIHDNDSHSVTANTQQDLITLGGRVYMTNVSLAGREYTLVIDTGSSDTWIAASTFQCVSSTQQTHLQQKSCGFGTLYDIPDSTTFQQLKSRPFGVRYTDGEFLTGVMGTEKLGIGGPNEDQLHVRQTIGVAQKGWWMGDGLSSGLMGLAYPTLASNVRSLNYTSVIWTLWASPPDIPTAY
jgi:hypothetical protein